eukprot:CAMPEP_0172775482 /NCGR_PEP_ID=MMETSP1074-20121228/198057_1 /TAXON_ID=2916 /ORGANISM="Ceratium fusus, Strain PA161109" /LENGTH=35 /DNA_ID= /DNA_START= /DNA_END= /DNA_ORIENTATION=
MAAPVPALALQRQSVAAKFPLAFLHWPHRANVENR